MGENNNKDDNNNQKMANTMGCYEAEPLRETILCPVIGGTNSNLNTSLGRQ